MSLRLSDVRFTRPGGFDLEVPALEIAAGRVTALLGANGAGKTTLLRLVAGLERPARGRVGLGAGLAPVRPEQLAYAFQEAVFLGVSVRANLELGLRLRRVPPAERARRIERVADECGVAHLLDRTAARLSGGEQQRVNLARALALDAEVTLLDEPLAGLDAPTRARLLDELPGMLAGEGRTVLVVAHDRREAFALADELVLLAAGRVRAAGPRRDLLLRPPDAESARLLGYTVLEAAGARFAIADGDLCAGAGEPTFDAVVERTLDMGTHLLVKARIGDERVGVRLPAETPPPAPGSRLSVGAARPIRLG